MGIKARDLFVLEHVVSALVSILFGAITYFPLRNNPSFGEQGASYLGLFLGISTLIITDRIFYTARMRELKDDIRESVTLAEVFDDTSRYFTGTLGALAYVHDLIPLASRIWNTRFYCMTEAPAAPDVERLKVGQDQLILAQALSGATFEFICGKEYKDDVEFFRRGYERASAREGEILLYTLDTHDLPLLQMIGFEFKNGRREVLVGWIFSAEKGNTVGVWAIKNQKAANFFLSIFDMYKEFATK